MRVGPVHDKETGLGINRESMASAGRVTVASIRGGQSNGDLAQTVQTLNIDSPPGSNGFNAFNFQRNIHIQQPHDTANLDSQEHLNKLESPMAMLWDAKMD